MVNFFGKKAQDNLNEPGRQIDYDLYFYCTILAVYVVRVQYTMYVYINTILKTSFMVKFFSFF